MPASLSVRQDKRKGTLNYFSYAAGGELRCNVQPGTVLTASHAALMKPNEAAAFSYNPEHLRRQEYLISHLKGLLH